MDQAAMDALLGERDQLYAQLRDVGRELLDTRSERDAVRVAYDALCGRYETATAPRDGVEVELRAQLQDIGRELLETRSERDAVREENEKLRCMYNTAASAHGTMETIVHNLKYQATSLRWRWKSVCEELFGPAERRLPPRSIPAELFDRYSMDGKVEVTSRYVNSTAPPNWPLIYTDAEIDEYLKVIRTNLESSGPDDGKNWFVYGLLDRWMCDAIQKHPICGMDVVNIGSLTPWYEAMFIHFGARPVTIDYNRILLRTKRMQFMTIAEWESSRRRFGAGFSISSFEHDGLGAYGDPLDPDGDLKAMAKMKERIEPGGLLYLAVPTGRDKVAFNQARIYGRTRLPLLLQGWEWVDSFGFDDTLFEADGSAQPVYVLRNV